MCPYYLDGDRTLRVSEVFGDTRRRRAYRHGGVWLLCSFQGPLGGAPGVSRAGLSKLNSMLPLKLGGMQSSQGQVRSTY